MKTTLLSIIFFAFLTNLTNAEVIDGPANLRIEPKGGILISLNDGTQVTCFRLKNGWFKISLEIQITKQQYETGMRLFPKGSIIKAGAKLYNTHNKFIGVAIADITGDLTLPQSYGGFRSPVSYEIEMDGYVAKSNIKVNSIPENILDSVFIANKEHLDYERLKGFMLKQEYKNQHMINRLLPKFNEYCIYESEESSAGYRIGLIFENNDLIAIEHSRPINIVNNGNFKDYKLAQGNEILMLKSPRNRAPSTLINKINETFSGAD